ncbi:MAG: 1,4-dihydroxy-2-naphthoate octaprenyltransferase [Deltaproteobacteria bacterium]|nr:1,4-dihydroxy-2-naphthoate octaprenyltransferase [Deltaproteobacteria bacterium]
MSRLGTWFLATRPWSFSMSAISVSVGAALAAGSGFSAGLYVLTLAGMVLLHGATNLINDYFDVKNRVDVPDAPTVKYRPHPLADRELGLNQVLAAAVAMYAAGIGIGLFLAATRGWPVLAIGAVGVAVSLCYTAPLFPLKYKALGEVAVFFMWGPLSMLGAYYVQSQALSWTPVLVSIPFGTLVGLVLLANNLRDREHDRRQGIFTLAVLLGGRGGNALFAGLIVAAFAGIGLMSLAGPLSPISLLVFLAAPLAAPLLKMVKYGWPDDADARTAKLDTAFGVLLLASLILNKAW